MARRERPQTVPFTPVNAPDRWRLQDISRLVPRGWHHELEAAFQRVREANAKPGGPVADLVMFITDGDPNTYNTPLGERVLTPDGNVTVMRVRLTRPTCQGEGRTPRPRRRRCRDGYREPGAPHGGVGDQEVPADGLRAGRLRRCEQHRRTAGCAEGIATGMCKGSVTVAKLVNEGDGVFRPDPGWAFRAGVTTSKGGYRWISPGPPTRRASGRGSPTRTASQASSGGRVTPR